MRQALLLLALALTALDAPAGEAPECIRAPFEHAGHSPRQLRAIAAACPERIMARLYYNRAYHLELLEDFRALGSLISYGGAGSSIHAEAYRTLIGLYEAFARAAWQRSGGAQVIAALNDGYEKATAVAELRLKGQDNLADHLASTQFDQ
jgi:hypothetical protein